MSEYQRVPSPNIAGGVVHSLVVCFFMSSAVSEEIDFIRTHLLDRPLDVAGCVEIELRSKIMAAGPLTLTERNE